jgi:hypothetical protein
MLCENLTIIVKIRCSNNLKTIYFLKCVCLCVCVYDDPVIYVIDNLSRTN